MVTGDNDENGDWQEWGLVRLGTCKNGDWLEWLLARMVTGENGDWRLVKMPTGDNDQLIDKVAYIRSFAWVLKYNNF